ncbi:uncharacterized protein FOMMEDRAFT_162545 [Fomitiporia mediterranea MF3/22]|uniref:Uncharacterized protein n=1 Tax=Fomitiporia mediterranea (strain MF3/22) TaxID=694068 RepID=R7SHK4_FOMME|nr:uncharacterized protein FOMMEDRAFT_162545 [Fomitiporia mediterranea MF3/22]EJC97737.1 hypothetical protein FOMMEDRAFT_162545 [Fomitiporia mediterranea MF3/22]
MSRTKKHAESSNGKAEAAIASKYNWDDAESISSFSSSNFGITLKGKTVDKGKPVAMEFMPSSKENDEIADNVCKIRGHLQRLMEARQIPSDHIGSEVGRDLVISNFRNAATFIKQQDESDDEAFRGDPTLHIEPGKWFEGEEYLAPEVTNEASSIQHGVIIMSPKVDIFAVGLVFALCKKNMPTE